jgi:hypothetical protein
VRRRGALASAAVALALAGAIVLGPTARAVGAAPLQEQQDEQQPGAETTENPVAPDRDIIPRPDSGSEPQDAGDRGGALQLAVLAAIVVGVSAVVTLAVRESRRSRQGSPTPVASGTGSGSGSSSGSGT